MLTLLSLIDRALDKKSDNNSSDHEAWLPDAEMQLDQLAQFFYKEWDAKDGVRWKATLEEVFACLTSSFLLIHTYIMIFYSCFLFFSLCT